jgi:transcriptional regulator with XRE-family HTH domain
MHEIRTTNLQDDVCGDPAVIGQRVNAFRTMRRITQRQLAEATQTTASFISQFERGLSGAHAGTLMMIATALDVSIADLFDSRKTLSHEVLSPAMRSVLPEAEGYRKTLLSRRSSREFEVYVGEFEPGGSTGDIQHSRSESHEMCLVLQGDVELTIGAAVYRMKAGDSIEYSTAIPHKTGNVGSGRAEVVWMTAPRTSAI